MKNVLIIRPSSIGDIVMASPMIRALKQAWPGVRISWLADPAAADLLAHHPELDSIIFWSKSDWRQRIKSGNLPQAAVSVRQVAQDLRKHRFDMAIDAQGLFRSRILARLSGAKQRIGFESKEPGRFLMTRIISRGPEKISMGSEYRHLMHCLGIDPQHFHPAIVLSETDLETARRKRRHAGLEVPYILFCPFTTRAQKHWFDERWAVLAEQIESRMHLPVALLGGGSDTARAKRIVSRCRTRIFDFTGKMSLGEAAGTVQGAALVIGVDTGLTHMGTAFEKPTVALFGATVPYLHTENPYTRILYEPRPCSPCKRRPVCSGHYHCMQALGVDRVRTTAESLLGTATAALFEHSPDEEIAPA